MPAYWPEDDIGETQAWAAMSQKDGSAGRMILAAVAADLQGYPLNHISGALLRLHDHEIQLRGPQRTPLQDGDPRAARRYRQGGRELLAGLGAWPWTHAPHGRLPTGWHRNKAFLDPLWAWHVAAVSELERECALARGAWGETERDWGLPVPREDSLGQA